MILALRLIYKKYFQHSDFKFLPLFMKTLCLFALSATILFSSCQKELDFSTPLTGGGGANPNCGSNSYFPLADGNTWSYDQAGVAKTAMVLPGDTVINGVPYKKVKETSPGTPDVYGYYSDFNGNVSMYISLSAAGVANGFVNQNVLRANAAVGDKWADTSIVNGVTEIFRYEMMEKNINYQVGSQTFTNVHHVKYNVYMDFAPIFINELIQTTDIYLAKCIGPVRSITQAFAFGTPVNSIDIKVTSYTLH